MTDLEKVHKLAKIIDMKKARNIIALDLCNDYCGLLCNMYRRLSCADGCTV